MQKKKVVLVILAVAFCFMCASMVLANEPVVSVTGGVKIAKDQPPVGYMTERSFIDRTGRVTKVDRDAIRIRGVKVGFWGNEGQQLSPLKPPAIQKWICGEMVVRTAFFSCEEQARAFLASPDREAMASSWRATLDTANPVPDPSRPGAYQVYLPLK